MENNYITEVLPQEWKSGATHIRFPSLGLWHWEKEPSEHLTLKASGTWSRELHRTGENRDSALRGCTQGLVNTRTLREKNSDCIAAWTRPTCWSWRVSWGSRRQLWLMVWARTLVAEVLGSTQMTWTVLDAIIWPGQDLAPTHRL